MPNTIEQVDRTVLDVLSELDGHPPEMLSRVQICLSEALYNLVLHADGSERSEPIEIAVANGSVEGCIRVEIYDPPGAKPFDLREHAPDLSQIDLLAESGRGLALIVECADSVDYGVNDDRHRLSLGFSAGKAANGQNASDEHSGSGN